MAAYARLYVVVPAGVAAILVFWVLGSALPQGRSLARASSLIRNQVLRRDYEAVLVPYGRLPGLLQFLDHASGVGNPPPAPQVRRILAGQQAAVTVARAAGLRRCRFVELSNDVYCDIEVLRDRGIVVLFWGGLGLAFIAGLAWLFFQFEDSWMLPYGGSHPWYTPAYAAALALMAGGPFVMASAYFARAASQFTIVPADDSVLHPGLFLYWLVVLQLAALVVASVKTRVSSTYFALLTLALPLTAASAYIVFSTSTAVTTILAAGLTLILASWTAWLSWRLIVSRSGRGFAHRLRRLTGGLVPGWAVYGVIATLRLADIRGSALSTALTIAGYAALIVYAKGSQKREVR